MKLIVCLLRYDYLSRETTVLQWFWYLQQRQQKLSKTNAKTLNVGSHLDILIPFKLGLDMDNIKLKSLVPFSVLTSNIYIISQVCGQPDHPVWQSFNVGHDVLYIQALLTSAILYTFSNLSVWSQGPWKQKSKSCLASFSYTLFKWSGEKKNVIMKQFKLKHPDTSAITGLVCIFWWQANTYT